MKKFIIMSLTALFALGLVGCKEKDPKCKEGEELKDGECVQAQVDESKLSYIINKLSNPVSIAAGDRSVELAQNECGKVTDAEFANKIKVSVVSGGAVICDNSDGTNTANDCPAKGHYEIVAEAGKNQLKTMDKPADVSACKALAGAAAGDPEYTIENYTDAAITVALSDKSVTLNAATGTPLGPAAAGAGCVKFKKSFLDGADAGKKLKVSAGSDVLCDGNVTGKECAEGHLQVKNKAADAKPEKVTSAATSCAKELK